MRAINKKAVAEAIRRENRCVSRFNKKRYGDLAAWTDRGHESELCLPGKAKTGRLNCAEVGEEKGRRERRFALAQQVGQYVNPVLQAIKRLGGSARPVEVCRAVAKDLRLEGSPVLEETLSTGVSKFENKIAWVRLYLVLTGYLDRSKRGVWTLTEKGKNAPLLSDDEVNQLLLDVQRQGSKKADSKPIAKVMDEEEADEESPEESGYKTQLLALIRSISPGAFERLCQRLLRESDFEQVVITGRSRDGGIDGIGVLKVNVFVAFKVLFQCKRYAGVVSSSVVRDFRGAMQGRADKGIILTTGSFSSDALKEAVRDGVPPIELVDGEKLVELFESKELGLIPRITYDVDPGFFAQFEQDT
jgi:restriction system protein